MHQPFFESQLNLALSKLITSPVDILEGILSLYSLSPITEAAGPVWPQEWSDKYFKHHKFQNWLNSIGITVKEVGEPMAGGIGRAYQVNDNTIVKFTTSDKEAHAAAIMQGQDSPHAANVHGIIKLNSWTDKYGIPQNLYAIAVEKLNTNVGGKIRIATNACYSYLDRKDRFIDDPYNAAEDAITFLRPNERKDKQTRDLVHKIMGALYKMQEETGVLSQDPHGGNIAFKNRNPAFFDYGRSKINWQHPKTAGIRINNLSEGYTNDITIVFHGTIRSKLKSIIRNGLGGKGKEFESGGGFGGIMDFTPKSQNEYITRHLGSAVSYAIDIAEDNDDIPVVLALEWRNPGGEFEYDEDEDNEDDEFPIDQYYRSNFAAPTTNLTVIRAWRIPDDGFNPNSPLKLSVGEQGYSMPYEQHYLTGISAMKWLDKYCKKLYPK